MICDCQSPSLVRSLQALQPGRRVDIASAIIFAVMPGVARRQPTFFASPKKVGKERRPEVRRPAKARGALRKALHGFPVRQARPVGRETPASPRIDRPLRNSGSKLCLAKGFYCARPQTVLADFPVASALLGDSHRGPGDLSPLSVRRRTGSSLTLKALGFPPSRE